MRPTTYVACLAAALAIGGTVNAQSPGQSPASVPTQSKTQSQTPPPVIPAPKPLSPKTQTKIPPTLFDKPVEVGQTVTIWDPIHLNAPVSLFLTRRAFYIDMDALYSTKVVGEDTFDSNEDSALEESNKVVSIPYRTTAKLLARQNRLAYVRILTGPRKGMKGYVSYGWLHPFELF